MIAAVFPGQGSQKPGMGLELFDTFPIARGIFETVAEATSVDTVKLCFELDEETLRQTQNAQLALYTCGVAAWAVLSSHCDVRQFVGVAGHSVGEYAALAAAGVLTVEDGARLVQIRGRLMKESGGRHAGTMAAVIGLDRGTLETVCADTEGIVVVANDNCPGQLVISGEVEADDNAGKLASERGAKRVLPLNVSGAFHSPLMEEASSEMGNALRQVNFEAGDRAVYSNVTSEKVTDSTEWPNLLQSQLRSPVRWTESVEHMRLDGIATFVECGVGEVLSGLIRRIDREAVCLKVYDQGSLQSTLAALAG
jgi:[acyl-carrier-protein] S-malonyltransferase